MHERDEEATPPAPTARGEKKYIKPRLRLIDLAVEETLAGGCKFSGASPVCDVPQQTYAIGS